MRHWVPHNEYNAKFGNNEKKMTMKEAHYFYKKSELKAWAYFLLRLTDKFKSVNVSQIRSNFIFLSSGLSVPNEDK